MTYDHIFDVLEGLKFIHRSQPVGGLLITDLSARSIDVFLRQALGDVLNRNPEYVESPRIEIDQYLVLGTSDDPRCGHSIEGFQRTLDPQFCQFPKISNGTRSGQRQSHSSDREKGRSGTPAVRAHRRGD